MTARRALPLHGRRRVIRSARDDAVANERLRELLDRIEA